MIRHCIKFVASLILICGITNGAAQAASRLALVIGNSNYRDVVALPNPEKDANAMADFLAQAKFDVTRANNLSQNEMRRALRDFAAKIAAAGSESEVVFHYGGHGVQIDGENYLIPVDAHITRESDVPMVAVRLTDVMNILASVPAKTRIVILDACRNNPFAAIDKNIARGLAIPDARRNSIIAYATAPGATALDGDGDHSPFTAALLKVAAVPGLAVEQAFKEVRLAVNKATDGQQTPWESSSLFNDFAFIPGQGESDKPKVAMRKEDVSQDTRQQQEGAPREVIPVAVWKNKILNVSAEQAYDLVVGANTVEAYEAFLAVYPKFKYVTQVRKLVERRLVMIAWYYAFTINTVNAFEAFLAQYPDSDLAETAKRLLDRAKDRSLPPNALANANNNASPAAGSAATSTRVVVKVVEKVIEKPVVRERIVKQIVHVPAACDCKRPSGGIIIRAPIKRQNDHPTERRYTPNSGFQGGIMLQHQF